MPDIKEVQMTITVSRTYKGSAAGEAEQIEIAPFVTEPAKVHVELSKTIQLRQYEPLNLRVGVTLPCYKEEVSEAMTVATEYAKNVLLQQVNTLAPFVASLDREVSRVKNF